MIQRAISALRATLERQKLPEIAKRAVRTDREGLPAADPGIDASTRAAMEWLLLAQRSSLSRDGGVARHYSLLTGWAPSYPETTGYILPTVMDWAEAHDDEQVLDAARAMADFLVAIQFEEGGFQGGMIGADPFVPVTFNTGQILMGLARAATKWGEPYRSSMERAAQWLVDTQDADGCWRRYQTPFAEPGEKAYETHVSWGLFDAARVAPAKGYEDKAFANIRWALSQQRDNGWVEQCCLVDPSAPLTHTLGYYLRGVVEAHRFRPQADLLEAAERTARGLMSAVDPSGFLPGRLDARFRPTVSWSCLTGSVQIAHSLFLLYRETGEESYRDTGYSLNRYVRRTVDLDGPEETRGAIKGSFPIGGSYGDFEYLNWAGKFFIDSNLVEAEIRAAH